MKHLPANKQKWILTATLIAVLGSTYSNQISSANMGSFDLASTGSNEVETQNEAYLAGLKQTKDTIVVAPEKPRSQMTEVEKAAYAVAALERKTEAKKLEDAKIAKELAEAKAAQKELERLAEIEKQKLTQAAAAEAGACKDGCNTAVASSLTKEAADQVKKMLATITQENKAKDEKIKELELRLAEKTTPTKKDDKDDKDEKETKKETATERRVRLAKEKRDKAQHEREEKIENFETEMNAVRDICGDDMKCMTTEFAKALKDNFSSDKNAVPATIVNRYFKTMIGNQLTKAIANGDTGAVEAIEALMSKLPQRYASIKQSIMASVQTSIATNAKKVNEEYKQWNAVMKQKGLGSAEAGQQLKVAQTEHQELIAQADAFTSAIEMGSMSDNSALSYYQRSFLPNMQKIMNNVNSTSDTSMASTNPVTGTTRNTRAGVTTNNSAGTHPVNKQWTTPQTTANGVQVGAPTNTSRGGRGPSQ